MAALVATYHPISCNTVAIPSILSNLTNIDLIIFVNKHFKRSNIHNAGFNQKMNHFKIYIYARLSMLTRLPEFWLSAANHSKRSFGINIYFEWLPMSICNVCIHFQQIGVEGMSWQTSIYDNDKMSISTFLDMFC